MLEIRRAAMQDSRNLWEWRNDAATREASLSSDFVEWDDHVRWFNGAISDHNRAIYVGRLAGEPTASVGMCRFDIEQGMLSAEVSINLNPEHRGKGLSRPLLNASIENFHREFTTVGQLTALIRESNVASKKLFASVGFSIVSHTDGVGKYSLSLMD